MTSLVSNKRRTRIFINETKKSYARLKSPAWSMLTTEPKTSKLCSYTENSKVTKKVRSRRYIQSSIEIESEKLSTSSN